MAVELSRLQTVRTCLLTPLTLVSSKLLTLVNSRWIRQVPSGLVRPRSIGFHV